MDPWELSPDEIMGAGHIRKISQLLPPEKEPLFLREKITLTAEEFDSTIGVYIKANEKEIRRYWKLKNRKEAETYEIFESIIKALSCEVELNYVLSFRTYKVELDSLIIHPLNNS